jgi:hypothetical protein
MGMLFWTGDCCYGYVNSVFHITSLSMCFYFQRNHTNRIVIFFVLGSSIHACRDVERHIVALEADEVLFYAVLKSLIRSSVASEVTCGATASSEDPKGDVLVVLQIVKRSRFSK